MAATNNVSGRNYLKWKFVRMVLNRKIGHFNAKWKIGGMVHCMPFSMGTDLLNLGLLMHLIQITNKVMLRETAKGNNAFGRERGERKRWTYELTENGENDFEQMWSEKYGREITSTTKKSGCRIGICSPFLAGIQEHWLHSARCTQR